MFEVQCTIDSKSPSSTLNKSMSLSVDSHSVVLTGGNIVRSPEVLPQSSIKYSLLNDYTKEGTGSFVGFRDDG